MPSVAYKLLGREKIEEIYKKYEIKPDEKKLIEEILEEWDKHINDIDKRADIFFKKTEKTEKKQGYFNILRAVYEISAEFTRKSLELEEKSSKNIH